MLVMGFGAGLVTGALLYGLARLALWTKLQGSLYLARRERSGRAALAAVSPTETVTPEPDTRRRVPAAVWLLLVLIVVIYFGRIATRSHPSVLYLLVVVVVACLLLTALHLSQKLPARIWALGCWFVRHIRR